MENMKKLQIDSFCNLLCLQIIIRKKQKSEKVFKKKW